MEISWLGHSTFLFVFNDSKIIVDPFLKNNPVFNNNNFDIVTEKISHIVLSHGHSDHLGDTIEIAKKNNSKVIANADLCSYLSYNGLNNLSPGNTGGTIIQDSFSVTFTQAKHSSAIIDKNGTSHSLGNANGLIFHINNEKTIYHMGDTDIFGDMKLIDELHKPSIGIVPIGDRFTMGGAVAALACRRFFNFEKIIPCHYGTFDLIDKDASKFLEAMEDESHKVIKMDVEEVIKI